MTGETAARAKAAKAARRERMERALDAYADAVRVWPSKAVAIQRAAVLAIFDEP